MAARLPVEVKYEYQLRRMAAALMPQRKMAEVLGCGQGTISRALRNIPHVGPTRDIEGPRTAHRFIITLREERRARGMSQKELAKLSGYGRSQIVDWELGRANIPPHALADLAQSLGFELKLERRQQ